MVSLGLGYLGQPVFTTLLEPFLVPLGVVSSAWLHSISFAVGFIALTFLHIMVGELAPKWLTIQKPLPVALGAAYPVALVLPGVLSVQPVAELRGPLAFGTNRH